MTTPFPAAIGPTESGYSAREALSVLLAMIALSVTLNVVVLPFTQVVDPVRRSFAIDDVAFSLLVGAFYAIPSMVMSVAGGWLADRSSRRRLLTAAVLLWTAGAVGTALAQSYAQLAAARIIVALGAGIKFPLAMTWINDAFAPERRGRAVGAFFVVLGLGPALGASLGGLVLQAAEAGGFGPLPFLSALEPWRIALLVLALPNLVLLPWVGTLNDRRASNVVSRAEVGKATSTPTGSPLLALVAMVLAAGLLSLADTANLTWLPTVLRRQHGYDAQQVGFTFGLIATVAGSLGPILGGLAGDAAFRRRGTAGRLWLCAAAAALSAPLLASYASSNPYVLVAALLASGVLSVLALSLGYVAIQALLPSDRRGVGTGVVAAMTQVFAAAAPTVVALIAARAFDGSRGIGTAVAIVTICALIGAAATYAFTAWRLAAQEREGVASASSSNAATTSVNSASAS